jgi:hypothetical protein
MNYHHAATTDPSAFSLWPDASASSEEVMVSAQTVGYTQQGLTNNSLISMARVAQLLGDKAIRSPLKRTGVKTLLV